MLVHLAMNSGYRFLKRAFEKSLVIVVAVMMRRRARLPLQSAMANVLQTAIYEGQHVVHSIGTKDIVGAAARQVDW